MSRLTKAAFCGWAIVVAPFSSAASLNQIPVNQSDLVEPNLFGPTQVFPDAPAFNSMILSDFNGGGGELTEIDSVITFSHDVANQVQGFRVSVFSSASAAQLSGVGLQGGALHTIDVSPSDVSWTVLTETKSNGADTRLYQIPLPHWSTTTDVNWIGVAPILVGGTGFHQSFGLVALNPAVVSTGGGILNNDVAVNPGGGFPFTFPRLIDGQNANAAYRLTVVPEPSCLFLCAVVVPLFVKRARAPRT